MTFGGWRLLHDLSALVRHPSMVWEQFLVLVQSCGAGSGCYWPLRLAQGLVDAPIPTEAMDELRPPGLRIAEAALLRHFALQLFQPEQVSLPISLTQRLWVLGMRPGRSGYGEARPWNKNETFLPTEEDAEQPRLGLSKVGHHFTSVPHYLRYGWRVLWGKRSGQ